MKYNILLDDERTLRQVEKMSNWNPVYKDGLWVIIRTSNDFINMIRDTLPEVVSFDNDLGEDTEGYDCLKSLITICLDRNLPLPRCLVHSQNNVAVENMTTLIYNFNKHVK